MTISAYILFCFVFLVIPCRAAVYYVSTTGLDANPGTIGSPWLTIQHASDTMSAGDSVIVKAGSYTTERVQVQTSGTPGNPITYQAQGTVIMKGWLIRGGVSTPVSNIVVNGFEISSPSYSYNDRPTSSGVYVYGSVITVESNYVHDAPIVGINLYGVPGSVVCFSNTIRANRCWSNCIAGIEIHGENNLIDRNEVWGTVQLHPSVIAVEGTNLTDPHLLYQDADGIRYFGAGHILRSNYLHDFGIFGTMWGTTNLNMTPHPDAFQTWTDDTYNEAATNVLIECNRIVHAIAQSSIQNGCAFMFGAGGSLMPEGVVIRNNAVKAFKGVNGSFASNLWVLNNTFANDLSLSAAFNPAGVIIANSGGTKIQNNIFYDQQDNCIALSDAVSLGSITCSNLMYRSVGVLVSNNTYYPAANRARDLWAINPVLLNPYSSPPDYHLTGGSPCIKSGTNALVPYDFDGNTRGTSPDIGAYQWSTNKRVMSVINLRVNKAKQP